MKNLFRNGRNGQVKLHNTHMSYVSFGHGPHVFVILPGLSDGLTTVRGKALLLSYPYRKYFEQYTIYIQLAGHFRSDLVIKKESSQDH